MHDCRDCEVRIPDDARYCSFHYADHHVYYLGKSWVPASELREESAARDLAERTATERLAEIEQLRLVLWRARDLFATQYIAQRGEVVPGQPFRVMTFSPHAIDMLRAAVQACAPKPLARDKST